ncbi:hypothetical protein J2Y46_000240 [Microbacterium sp. BE35]|uniref:hypothetical protein n=1 Tax=Microbacterium sp. BE35 TaxID=2817773 RepID=UPI0028671A5B|nr:hypothetical protein [Microbacterium sp. BE35]MDR7187424.1 hypothetical protein [Microbacterium sp. BE35]
MKMIGSAKHTANTMREIVMTTRLVRAGRLPPPATGVSTSGMTTASVVVTVLSSVLG